MTKVDTKGKEAREALEKIKFLLKTGKISYDNAKYFATEPLKILNDEMYRISKELGRKHYKITFSKFMR